MPGFSAILTQLIFEHSLRGLGWKLGRFKYLLIGVLPADLLWSGGLRHHLDQRAGQFQSGSADREYQRLFHGPCRKSGVRLFISGIWAYWEYSAGCSPAPARKSAGAGCSSRN